MANEEKEQVKEKAEVKAKTEAKPKTEAKATTEVKAKTEAKATTEVKAKTEAKAESKAAPAKRESSSDSRRSSSDRDDRPSRDDRSRGNDDRSERKPFRRFYRRRQNQIVPAYVDWKDVEYLERFVPERGKIMPRRISGVTAKDQRRIARAIKRARVMALLPYVGD